MNKNHAGAIVHTYIIKQNKLDAEIDRKLDKEPFGVPKPRIMANGRREWVFK